MMAHTVLRFYYIKFDDYWMRDAPDVTYVALKEGARLAVISRESGGHYRYVLLYDARTRGPGAGFLPAQPCLHPS
jgi:hypothetical protein